MTYEGTFTLLIGINEALVLLTRADKTRPEVAAEFHSVNHLRTRDTYCAITLIIYWQRIYHTVKTFDAECIDF